MPGVFDKLNLKEHREILVVDAPPSFEKELERLQGVRVLRNLGVVGQVSFTLLFVSEKAQLDRLSKAIAARSHGDMVLWFAYPKSTSKRLTCAFNRDNGWDVIRTAGFDSVRQVAIDADWSALRFRRLEFINRRS
jgi:hypothetical protein